MIRAYEVAYPKLPNAVVFADSKSKARGKAIRMWKREGLLPMILRRMATPPLVRVLRESQQRRRARR